MSTYYDIGDLARIYGTFTDDSGAPTDPDEVTAQVQRYSVFGVPDAPAEATPQQQSPGVWYVDVPVTADGTWVVRLVGTGAVQQTAETVFFARSTLITPVGP